MHSPRYIFRLLVPLVLTFSCWTRAQEGIEYSAGADLLFKRAIGLFDAKRYDESVEAFEKLIREFPSSQRTSAAYVMKGKGLLLMDEPLLAAQTLKSFLAEFPLSTYVPDAEFTLGLVQYRLQRYDDAMNHYITAWEQVLSTAADERLRGEILDAVEATAARHMPIERLKDFASEGRRRPQRALFWLLVGEKEVDRGNVAGAAVALDTISYYYEGELSQERLAELERRIRAGSSVRLGLLLPLMASSGSSGTGDVGTDIYKGIQYALAENEQRSGPKVSVTLEVRDTERDPLVAARGAQELTAMENVLAIIGPIFSNTTLSVAGLVNRRGVPLVTPTANSDGITTAGSFVFQANPDYQTRGRAMAQYAVRTKGYKTLAVLAPAEGHGRAMAEAFSAEAARLGATVAATEWYERGTKDLQPQLSSLRRVGFFQAQDPMLSFSGRLTRIDIAKLVQLGVPMKRIDSLTERSAAMKASKLLGPRAKERLDSVGIYTLYGKTGVDSLEIKVDAFDAIYAPINAPDEVGVVAAQVVYFNLDAQILGSGEWDDPTELNEHKRYCSGVIFDSDTYVDEASSRYLSFAGGFADLFGRRPTKFALYGYDAAALMISLIQRGATTRENMARALRETTAFEGLHAKIGFSPDRVNTWLHILQFDGTMIKKVGEVDTERLAE